MTKTLDALYDGKVLRPEESLPLRPNTRVRITVEAEDAPEEEAPSFLNTARALNLDGPPDWAERLDDYLYRAGGDDA